MPKSTTNGRAKQGYTCNTELVGSYTVPNALGTVAGFKVERYVDAAGHDCAYYDTTLAFPTNIFDMEAGVNVLDMSDPTNPVLTDTLRTPAMLTPHESLIVSHSRGLLVAVAGTVVAAPGIVDIYDISQDCRHPVLKSVTPVGLLGHESGISPDGKTFYAASPGTPTVTAIDISNPLAAGSACGTAVLLARPFDFCRWQSRLSRLHWPVRQCSCFFQRRRHPSARPGARPRAGDRRYF